MYTQTTHVTLEVGDRYGLLPEGSKRDYFMDSLDTALALVDVQALHIPYILLRRLHCRAMNTEEYDRQNIVIMDPTTRSFQPDYRGYKYKTFGGRADLTPGGVFLHECGHSVHRLCPGIRRDFKALRSVRGNKTSITSYATKYLDEDIAECFRLFAANPLELYRLDKRRFDIMRKYCVKFCNHADLTPFKKTAGSLKITTAKLAV